MKIAIITGASSGMGHEAVIQIADRFGGLEEIWVIARRGSRLEELQKKLPVPLRIFPMDITTKAAIQRLSDALEEQTPDVKILVNAAGYGKMHSVGAISMEEENGMVRLNCEALCAVTHAVLPYISNHSRIIQFASAAAFMPQPGFSIYAATKAFVLSYSRSLGMELKSRDIIVTAVCPGPVKTEFFQVSGTIDTLPLLKKLSMADPKKVVQVAIRDSMMGKSMSVYGILMKLCNVLCKIIPHDLALKFVTAIQGDEYKCK